MIVNNTITESYKIVKTVIIECPPCKANPDEKREAYAYLYRLPTRQFEWRCVLTITGRDKRKLPLVLTNTISLLGRKDEQDRVVAEFGAWIASAFPQDVVHVWDRV